MHRDGGYSPVGDEFLVIDVEVGQTMAAGRIRRSARRGVAVAVIGWLGAAALALLMAPSAAAAPTATVEIKNLTPPVASVDKGGTVTFVNKIPAANKGGISIPLVGSVSATVYTDVALTFFGQPRPLQTNQSTSWTFTDPATTGTITYTYRIVPQAGLAVSVANQVINTVASQLPALPAPTPYVVQTVAPNLPNLPSVNLPQLPQVNVQVPLPTDPGVDPPKDPGNDGGPTGTGADLTGQPTSISGNPYAYDTGRGAPHLSPSAAAAAAAFDPARYLGSGAGSSGSGGSAGGSGGAAG